MPVYLGNCSYNPLHLDQNPSSLKLNPLEQTLGSLLFYFLKFSFFLWLYNWCFSQFPTWNRCSLTQLLKDRRCQQSLHVSCLLSSQVTALWWERKMKYLGDGKNSIRIHFDYFKFRQLFSGYINFPCIRSIIFHALWKQLGNESTKPYINSYV